jgi:hypothetical protein
MRSFSDPETCFSFVDGAAIDGHHVGEPGALRCCCCGAQVPLDGPEGHQTAVDDLPHDRDCPQRDVVSRYWMRRFAD